MILNTVRGDVLETEHDVVFAINAEGANDAGLAGVLSRTIWPELDRLDETHPVPFAPGTVFSIQHGGTGRNFHAVVAHSLHTGEWYFTAITTALDRIHEQQGPTPRSTAVVWMGAGPIGILTGVDPQQTRDAIERSKLRCVLYHL